MIGEAFAATVESPSKAPSVLVTTTNATTPPIKLCSLRLVHENELDVYDVTGIPQVEIERILTGHEGEDLEWYDNQLVLKHVCQTQAVAAMWVSGLYSVVLRESRWIVTQRETIASTQSWRIPTVVARYKPLRGLTPHQMDVPQISAPLPHLVGEVEWNDLIDKPNRGIHKISSMLGWLGAGDTRIDEGWICSVSKFADNDAPPLEVVEIPVAEQPIIQAQAARPPAGTFWLGIITRGVVGPNGDAIREYYPLTPNARFQVPAYSILAAGTLDGSPGAPILVVNDLLEMTQRITVRARAPRALTAGGWTG
jgi:hypothetical protein